MTMLKRGAITIPEPVTHSIHLTEKCTNVCSKFEQFFKILNLTPSKTIDCRLLLWGYKSLDVKPNHLLETDKFSYELLPFKN